MPITPPPGAQHSSVADVYVPAGARPVPEDRTPTGETWDLEGPTYADAVAQEEALLPVGRPLGGYPWCEKRALGGNGSDNMSWLWGGEKDAIVVSVNRVTDNYSTIVIRHGSCSTQPIPW